jgi:energy-converting hydrogenase Eha subunit G
MTDPILRRRQRAAQLAKIAKRYGYLLWLAAVVIFFVALATGLPNVLTTMILVCMAVGSVLLLPAIVVGYGVKAADREDRERGQRIQ